MNAHPTVFNATKATVLQILVVLPMIGTLCVDTAFAQDDLRIWREFVSLLRSGDMTTDRIRPHPELEGSEGRLLGYLEIARRQALPEEWDAHPEVIRRDSLVHYITSLTTNQQRIPYCFTFVVEDEYWYFRHLEAIFIRLDTVSTFPAREFPDVNPEQKAWAREEIYWSFVVLNVYLPAKRDRGKEYALGLLKDGGGYFLGAKTWVPFTEPHKAFVLYLCWEQARLRGNDVVLHALTDSTAVVEIQSHYLALYDIAGHLKPVITASEYREIFETIWQDRADKAGWQLKIVYGESYTSTFHFKRAS